MACGPGSSGGSVGTWSAGALDVDVLGLGGVVVRRVLHRGVVVRVLVVLVGRLGRRRRARRAARPGRRAPRRARRAPRRGRPGPRRARRAPRPGPRARRPGPGPCRSDRSGSRAPRASSGAGARQVAHARVGAGGDLGGVADAVAVGVDVAVADAVVVGVGGEGIEAERDLDRVRDAVAVGVLDAVLDAVVVGVGRVGGGAQAELDAVGDAVAVGVGVRRRWRSRRGPGRSRPRPGCCRRRCRGASAKPLPPNLPSELRALAGALDAAAGAAHGRGRAPSSAAAPDAAPEPAGAPPPPDAAVSRASAAVGPVTVGRGVVRRSASRPRRGAGRCGPWRSDIVIGVAARARERLRPVVPADERDGDGADAEHAGDEAGRDRPREPEVAAGGRGTARGVSVSHVRVPLQGMTRHFRQE